MEQGEKARIALAIIHALCSRCFVFLGEVRDILVSACLCALACLHVAFLIGLFDSGGKLPVPVDLRLSQGSLGRQRICKASKILPPLSKALANPHGSVKYQSAWPSFHFRPEAPRSSSLLFYL